MADYTVENVLSDAADELADYDQDVFTNERLLKHFRKAYGVVWDCLLNNDVQVVDREVTYTLPANTTSLTPATAGIASMGEPQKLWERGSTAEDYVLMESKTELPQADPDTQLRWWKWEGDTLYFVGATSVRILKIEYQMSADAPTTGSVGLDGARNLLAVLTAAYAAPAHGMSGRGAELKLEAFGPSGQPDVTGGLLRQFVNPMVKEKNNRSFKPVRFRPYRLHI